MITPKLLAFAGSARRDSLNRKLLQAVVANARAQGAEVTVLDLQSDTLPLYDGDLEARGTPASVLEMKRLFAAHDGLLIASPEYNMFFTPLMKNLIDWLSRPVAKELPSQLQNPLAGKTAVLFATSPGPFGGLRALPFLRLLLSKLGVVVNPTDLAVGSGASAIGEGRLNDDKQQKALENAVGELIALTRKLKAG
jgi:chromate reductase, NAD(P)H dehydrogenase (quinone)